MTAPAATAAAAMASSRAGNCPANQAAPPSPSPAPASEPTTPMIVPSVITSRASVLSCQPKLRRVASSAARSRMFRNTTSATASTPSATVAPPAT